MSAGSFIISLDFELYWGIHDVVPFDAYRENLEMTPSVVERLLSVFSQNEIRATWATVGLLFCRDGKEVQSFSPEFKPTYADLNLSPYSKVNALISDGIKHVLFAPSLIRQILSTPGQELATHTFSHYYCLEPGQNASQFRADLKAAMAVAEASGQKMRSIVFPRNQYSEEYLNICSEFGISSFRGTQQSSFYQSQALSEEPLQKRAGRLLDAYVNVSGFNTYKLPQSSKSPVDLPASAFLRPYSKKLAALEPLKIRRVKNSMTYAAKRGEIFHLWWHPHNFGSNTEENFEQLSEIIQHFQKLKADYDFKSQTMAEAAEGIIQ